MEWINPKDELPPTKEGWNHSERVLVWYEGNEHEISKYGIAYYHYDPPFGMPMFVDFAHYGKQPTLWTIIDEPKI